MNELIIDEIVPSTSEEDSNESTDNYLSNGMIMKINARWMIGKMRDDFSRRNLPAISNDGSNEELTSNKATITKRTNTRCSRHLGPKFS